MKKAIAMRCTQEQFDAIKPKLKGVTNITDFPYCCYLVNNFRNVLGSISNIPENDKVDNGRTIHETWNEKIFLEACGISTVPTIEEIKKHFENAKTIQCLDDNDEYIIDFTQEFDATKSCIWLLNQVDKPYSGSNTMCMVWNIKYGYAKILTYKKPPRTNKLTELEKRVDVLENKNKMNTGAITALQAIHVGNELKKAFDSVNTIGENIKLKLRIEELEAENKMILASGTFPVYKTDKLEVGKWYKSDMNGLWFIEKIINNNTQISYGINKNGKWCESGQRNSTGCIEATDSEVFEALKNEAVNRGFGPRVYIKDCGDTKDGVFCYHSKFNYLYCGSYSVFLDGRWAEINPSITKSEAEKQLNKKIVD